MKRVVPSLIVTLSLLSVLFLAAIEWLWLPNAVQKQMNVNEKSITLLMQDLVKFLDAEQVKKLIGEEVLVVDDPQHQTQIHVEWAPVSGSELVHRRELDDRLILFEPIPETRFRLRATLWLADVRQQVLPSIRVMEVAVILAMLFVVAVVLIGVKRWVLKPMSMSFRQLSDSLGFQRQQLEEQNERYRRVEERLEESHEIARLGCWEWQADNESFWCSRSLKSILEPLGDEPQSVEAFFHRVSPADKPNLVAQFKRVLISKRPLDIDFRISSDDGTRHVHLMCYPYFDDHGKVVRVTGTCQDITERKLIQSSLQQLSSAITYSGSSVMIINSVGAIEYVNPKFTDSTGYRLDEVIGKQPELLSRKFLPAERHEALWRRILDGQHWRGELQSGCKEGESFWSLVSISPIHNEYDELTHFVIVSEDVSELKDAHAKMERLALYDELTGLPNRRFFFRHLSELIDIARPDDPAVVMLLDLDHFKTINDTQGHNVGDQLLIQVAQRLMDVLRDDDVAARLGGDEFAILMHPIESFERVQEVANNILQAISRPYMIKDHELQISTSLGMACLPKDGTSSEILLKHADLAMYQAKELGRNQFHQFTENLHEQLQTYLRYSREMPKALDSQQFKMVYQPQIDLKTGDIISVEALLRWEHPELGTIAPSHFISVAEETGFIITLGRWVFAEACYALRALNHEMGYNLRVAVNLSSRQFRDPDLLHMIQGFIEEYDIKPGWLEVEITESLLMQDISAAITTLKELQSMGVSIAIDDFGIGYSSFNYLKTLPINVLKVDREFIKDIPDHLDDMEITAAIISMAHRLSLSVVAEGIETEVQRSFLEEHQCDVGQGYLFSKPVGFDQLIEVITEDFALEPKFASIESVES
jgi:diguanylate cyclase (GGDEF)-like protein/PAS domain S-box-containing protein